jgi:hypothetical protein
VDGKVSALERAFQLARSGRLATVDDIKKQLRQEGYEVSSEYGSSLRSQLRELIKAAPLDPSAPPSAREATIGLPKRLPVNYGPHEPDRGAKSA